MAYTYVALNSTLYIRDSYKGGRDSYKGGEDLGYPPHPKSIPPPKSIQY